MCWCHKVALLNNYPAKTGTGESGLDIVDRNQTRGPHLHRQRYGVIIVYFDSIEGEFPRPIFLGNKESEGRESPL